MRSEADLIQQRGQQVVKVNWHKTASPPQMDSSIVFTSWRQCAFRCGHIGASWRIRLKLCFPWPTRVQRLCLVLSTNLALYKFLFVFICICIIQRANRPLQPFLHSSQQKIPIFTMGSSSLQNCPLPGGSGPPRCSLGPPESSTQMASQSF